LKNFFITLLAAILMQGCASVPMSSPDQDLALKRFDPPPAGMAGLYIFRNTIFGVDAKKSVSVDNQVLGQTAAYVYFHTFLTPGQHTISTETSKENSELKIYFEPGKNYFVEQYIRDEFPAFFPGSGIRLVSVDEGKKGVLDSKLAISQMIGNSTPPLQKTTNNVVNQSATKTAQSKPNNPASTNVANPSATTPAEEKVTVADFEGQYPVLIADKPLKGKLTKTKAGIKPYICVMSASANSQIEFTVSSKVFAPGISVYDANTEEMLESTTGKNPAKLSLSLKEETTLMIAVFSSNNASVGDFAISVK